VASQPTSSVTDAGEQNNTGPLGGPVIIVRKQQLFHYNECNLFIAEVNVYCQDKLVNCTSYTYSAHIGTEELKLLSDSLQSIYTTVSSP